MSSILPVSQPSRPWWARSSSRNSDPPVTSSSSSKQNAPIKPIRSFPSLLRDDSVSQKPEYAKHLKRSKSPTSKFNSIASAIGLKSRKQGGPTLAIQDPPSLLAVAYPSSVSPTASSPTVGQSSHGQSNHHSHTREFTNYPPAKSISSTVRSYDDIEPRTPSDILSPPERFSYQQSVMTLSDVDPFASRGIIVPHKVLAQDPSRLSAFSDGSNASSSDSHRRALQDHMNRVSFASGSSSSQSHMYSSAQHQTGEFPPIGVGGSLCSNLTGREAAMNRLSEPPSDPMKLLHRPPMRARGMTDVGPRSPASIADDILASTGTPGAGSSTSNLNTNSKASSSNAKRPFVIVRQASTPRLHRKPGPPPPIPVPPPPVTELSPVSGNGPGSDASTVQEKSKRLRKSATSSSSYHTAIEDSMEDDFDLHSAFSSNEESDSSGSSLSFASSVSENREALAGPGGVWSPREREFGRHRSRKSKSIDKGKSKEKDEENVELTERGWEFVDAGSTSKTSILTSVSRDSSPTGTLKKVLSQQSITSAVQRLSFASSLSASSHSMHVDDHGMGHEKAGREKEKTKAKALKKQRSFHHPRIPLPPLPVPLRHANSFNPSEFGNVGRVSSPPPAHADPSVSSAASQRRGSIPIPTMVFPSFPSLSASVSSIDKSSVSAAQPHTPVRKRLFSGSSLRRTTSAQAHSATDEDTRSIFSLPLESDFSPSASSGNAFFPNPLSPNDSMSSFWDDGDGNGGIGSPGPSRFGGNGHADYVPQQIMSPADMLKVEAEVQEEHDRQRHREQHMTPGQLERHRRNSTHFVSPPHTHDGHIEEFSSSASAFKGLNSGSRPTTASGEIRSRGNSSVSASTSTATVGMSASTPSVGNKWVKTTGSASMSNANANSEPMSEINASSPPSGLRFWERVITRSSHDHLHESHSPSRKHTTNDNAPVISSPLSPYLHAPKPVRGSSMVAKVIGIGYSQSRSPGPSTSQANMSLPTSPTSSSFIPAASAAAVPTTVEPPPSSLPPPPRRRHRIGSGASAGTGSNGNNKDDRRFSEIPIVPLSPPPARRPTFGSRGSSRPHHPSSTPTEERIFQHRSVMRKPSFLDIEDDSESSPVDMHGYDLHAKTSKRFDEDFLDLGRGKDSFDTVRSMDPLEIVGPG